MKRLTSNSFEVAPGEDVTIAVTPTGVGKLFKVVASERALRSRPEGDAFVYKVPFDDDSVLVTVAASFAGDEDPEVAQYAIVVNGGGGKSYKIATIFCPDPARPVERKRQLEFAVLS